MVHLISIIIPAYNAEKTIGKTIEALLKQNYPKKKYEIIIIDDGSKDNTCSVVSKYPVKMVKIKHSGPAKARNFGAKKSKGNIIIFTDADCVPSKNWIKNMVEPFKTPDIVGVSGTYKTSNSNKFMAKFSGYEIEQRHEKMKKQKYIDFIGTFSAAYKKDVFAKFGGFDTKFKTSSGEDPELSFRIAKAGLKMIFQPKAFVYHPHPDTLWRYLKQKYQRAVWRNLLYWSKHKEKILSADSYTSKLLLPQIFISGLILLITFGLFIFYHNFILSILLFFVSFFVIALLFNLDFINFLRKKEKKIVLLSPCILFLRNLVVVFGVLDGVFRYLFKKF